MVTILNKLKEKAKEISRKIDTKKDWIELLDELNKELGLGGVYSGHLITAIVECFRKQNDLEQCMNEVFENLQSYLDYRDIYKYAPDLKEELEETIKEHWKELINIDCKEKNLIEKKMDELEEMLNDIVHNIGVEFIYCTRAIEYLANNDPCLEESLEIAEEFGYSLLSDLNASVLATLLKRRYVEYFIADVIALISLLIKFACKKKGCKNEK